MPPTHAASELEAVFAGKPMPAGSGPLVGIFGNGVPAVVLTACGCRSMDVKSAPPERLGAHADCVAAICEPFVDDYASVFLHRLFAGDFEHLDAIVFAHADAAAFTAYLYASELLRQQVARVAPRLFLFNFAHGDSAAVDRFNAKQADRLVAALAAIGGTTPTEPDWQAALKAEAGRAAALARLEAMQQAQPPRVSGMVAMQWRNAGRYLSALDHAEALNAACDAVGPGATPNGPRIGLVGTALDDTAVYETIETVGPVVCDLQPFGGLWPAAGAATSVGDQLKAIAREPLVPGAVQADAMHRAMVARLQMAGCELVVAQYDRNDDTFGWDLPSLKRLSEQAGMAFADTGFRDHRPGPGWHERVRDLLTRKGEAANV